MLKIIRTSHVFQIYRPINHNEAIDCNPFGFDQGILLNNLLSSNVDVSLHPLITDVTLLL